MPLASEAYIGMPPDSTGKKHRLLEVTTLIAGVPTTVEMPVIALADADGNPLVFGDLAGTLIELREEAAIQTEILLRILRGTDGRQQSTTRDDIAAYVANHRE